MKVRRMSFKRLLAMLCLATATCAATCAATCGTAQAQTASPWSHSPAPEAAGEPDGSIFKGTRPTYIQTTVLSKSSLGHDGLDAIAIDFSDPEVPYTRGDSAHKTLADMMAFAKANPG